MTTGEWYERIPLREHVFLALETPAAPMHFGAVLVFEGASAATVDLDQVRSRLTARLPVKSRLRQRLARVPLVGDAVWVDDPDFELDYQISGMTLPEPPDDAQLRAIAGRLFSRPLPQDRPLWRLWLVERLRDGGFALVLKIHHAIANGTSVVGLLASLLDPTPDARLETPAPWTPRAVPGPVVLVGHALARRATLPLALARALPGLVGALPAALRAAGAVGGAFPRRSRSAGAAGPERSVDWLALDLSALRAAGESLGGTVNDVVLTAVTGAMARFTGFTGPLHVLVPVLLRDPGEPERASLWTVPLPIDERDPRRRFARVHMATGELKRSRAERGLDRIVALADVAGAGVVTLAARMAAARAGIDLLVTNVPGPDVPLFFYGARCVAAWPVPPLLPGQTLAIAVTSHAGRFFVGLAASRACVPDVGELTRALAAAFEELVALSRDGAPAAARSG